MKKNNFLSITLPWILLLGSCTGLLAQSNHAAVKHKKEGLYIQRPEGKVYGSLVYPESKQAVPLVIIISGSGPTDRDGNSGGAFKNNSLKKLAVALGNQGIASFRYDKKGVGASSEISKNRDEIVFMDFVKDVAAWTVHFKSDTRFNQIFLLGHSLGSLQAIKSAQLIDVDGLICLAGPGYTMDKLIYRQLTDRSPFLAKGAKPLLDSLVQGYKVKEIHPFLQSIIVPNLQEYLISVFQEDPANEISQLDIPSLIIVGTHDVQATTDDAESLHKAATNSKLVVIDSMNHVLVNSPKEFQENLETYDQAELSINRQLVQSLCDFILKTTQ